MGKSDFILLLIHTPINCVQPTDSACAIDILEIALFWVLLAFNFSLFAVNHSSTFEVAEANEYLFTK